jgi:hypothetical protein
LSEAKLVINAVKSTPYMARLSLSLMWTYFTLGYRVGKTRRAFEKQLVAQGMSKEDAQRLSACFEDLKNSIVTTAKRGLVDGGFRF